MDNEYVRRIGASVAAVIQPLVFSWIIVVVLSVFCYTISASSPALSEVTWQDAARLGTSLWVLALGGPFEFAGAAIGLMPLGATALITFAFYRWMRRYNLSGWLDVSIGALTVFLVTALIGLLALPGSLHLLGALGAAVIVAICGLLLMDWPQWLADAWRLAKPVFIGLALLAISVLIAGLAGGWSRVQDIQNYYLLGVFATVVFTIAQLFYLPNVLVWSLAYASGSGFAVGEGTSFSPFSVTAAPLPALPMFGALPGPDVSLPWIIALPILLGVAIGLWRRVPTLKQALIAGGSALVIILVVSALFGALASGGIGPGRMQEVGVTPPLFAIIVAAEAGGGLLAGLAAPRLLERLRQRKPADDTLPE